MAVQQYAENLRIPVQTLAEIAKFLLTCTVCIYTCISLIYFYLGLHIERPKSIGLETIIIPIVVIPCCLIVILVMLIIMIIYCKKKSRKSVPKSPSESVSIIRYTVTFLIKCLAYT